MAIMNMNRSPVNWIVLPIRVRRELDILQHGRLQSYPLECIQALHRALLACFVLGLYCHSKYDLSANGFLYQTSLQGNDRKDSSPCTSCLRSLVSHQFLSRTFSLMVLDMHQYLSYNEVGVFKAPIGTHGTSHIVRSQERDTSVHTPNREYMDYVLGLIRRGVFRIDEEGRIWRYAVLHAGRRKGILTDHLKPIEPKRAESIKGKGYLALTMKMPDGKIASVMAHRVIWEWFNGPIPDDLQINHKDLNKQNNQIENLEIVTGLENMRHSFANDRVHAYEHIKQKGGEWRSGRAMMTLEQRKEIIALRASGLSLGIISKKTGYTKQHIASICKKGV